MDNPENRVHNTKKNTTQYMLDANIRKQTQIAWIRLDP
jgi:hypothetical protein